MGFFRALGDRTLRLFGMQPRKVATFFLGEIATFDECELVAKYAREKLPPGVLFDVGASKGNVSRDFLDLKWEVHAFEPDNNPYKIKLLKRLDDRYINFRLTQKAVSTNSGETINFYTSPVSEGISSVHAFHDSHKLSHSVSTITIKDYVEDNDIGKIDFLKIDVEGHDLSVLRGVDFSKTAPSFIIAEFDEVKASKGGHSYDEITAFLTGKGYDILVFEWEPITEYGRGHNFKRMHVGVSPLSHEAAWGNVLAILPSESRNFTQFATATLSGRR